MPSALSLEDAATSAVRIGELAAECINNYNSAGTRYANLCGEEMTIEADRPGQKLAAIRRIMAGENDLTGGKHSASSAEKVAETDPEYRAFLDKRTEVVVQKNHAYTEREGARLQAEFALAAYKMSGGLR